MNLLVNEIKCSVLFQHFIPSEDDCESLTAQGGVFLRPRRGELPLRVAAPHEAAQVVCHPLPGPQLRAPQEDAGLQALHCQWTRYGQVGQEFI